MVRGRTVFWLSKISFACFTLTLVCRILLYRAIGVNLEIERLRLPKFYHYHHDRTSDWYEFARM